MNAAGYRLQADGDQCEEGYVSLKSKTSPRQYRAPEAIINRDTATHLTAIASNKGHQPGGNPQTYQQQPIDGKCPQPPTTVTRTTHSVIDEPPAKGL